MSNVSVIEHLSCFRFRLATQTLAQRSGIRCSVIENITIAKETS